MSIEQGLRCQQTLNVDSDITSGPVQFSDPYVVLIVYLFIVFFFVETHLMLPPIF